MKAEKRLKKEKVKDLYATITELFGPQGKLAKWMPDFEYRPPQQVMAQKVAEALGREGITLIEAGAGTGKSWAYLLPIVLSGKTVIISTGTKNLQEQLYLKDIPQLRKNLSLKFSSALLKGRGNYLCLRRYRLFELQPSLTSPQPPSYLKTIKRWSARTSTGDCAELKTLPENFPLWQEICSRSELCLGSRCPFHQDCFVTKVRSRANRSKIVIVNHHLFFADLAQNGELVPSPGNIIFDEAHNLEDIATRYFSYNLGKSTFDRFHLDLTRTLEINRLLPPLKRDLESLSQGVEILFRTLPPQSGPTRLDESLTSRGLKESSLQVSGLLSALGSRLENLPHSINNRAISPSEDLVPLAKMARELEERLLFIIGQEDPRYVYWYETQGNQKSLAASPIEIGETLRSKLYENGKSIIFTSATLSTNKSFHYFRQRLGIPEEAEELILDSPFDYQTQTVFYLPTHLPHPREEGFSEALAEELYSILEISRGRAFLLFTSVKNMKICFRLLERRLPYPLLIQGERPRSALLKEFREHIHSVLFATQSFWEGVDVVGEALSCVIVDKLPFEVPTDPIVQARMEAIEQKGESAFYNYQVPNAIMSLRQGLGRLIRTRRDWGMLGLLDSRVNSRPYGKIFLHSLPSCPRTGDIEELRSLFKKLETKNRM